MTAFTDQEAKAKCEAECIKRNKHMSKHLATTSRWKPLWTPEKGWKPQLRPAVEAIVKGRTNG